MRPEEVDQAATNLQPSLGARGGELSETQFAQRSTHGDAPAPPPVGGVEGWVGQSLDKYQITGVLGIGGMGAVLKARDPFIERDVAIKILGHHSATSETARARFLAEAKSAGKINHPNVVAIYGSGQQGATTYLVLEYVSGGSLADQLAGHRALPVAEATRALIDACKGVGAAHAAGLIHRDIKPANFMRASDGSIKVADFGLAKPADGSGREFTQAGVVVGTPYYMSPEQCEAKPLDHRSDVYSLGATYYALLTGKRPFHDAETVPQVMYAHCHGPIPDPRAVNPAVAQTCARVVARAMAKAPGDRYQSTAEMLADLQVIHAALSDQTHINLPSDTVPARTATQPGVPPVGLRSGRPSRRAVVLAAGGIAGGALAAWLAWGRTSQPRDAAEDTPEPPAARGA